MFPTERHLIFPLSAVLAYNAIKDAILLYLQCTQEQSMYTPLSQWEPSLQCNNVFHWLGAYLDWSLCTGCKPHWKMIQSFLIAFKEQRNPFVEWQYLNEILWKQMPELPARTRYGCLSWVQCLSLFSRQRFCIDCISRYSGLCYKQTWLYQSLTCTVLVHARTYWSEFI